MSRLSDWVERALEEEEEGSHVTPLADLCSEDPGLIPEVEKALSTARRLRRMQNRGMQRDPLIGASLNGRFSIEARIGAGAMGVVYSGRDKDLDRAVAIKVLGGSIVDRGLAGARFDREATAIAAVSHESVVKIFDRGTTSSGAPFLVMELVDGVPLATLLGDPSEGVADHPAQRSLASFGIELDEDESDLRRSVRWASQVADGLSAAHAAGVTHRDVKPSNIMIRRNGRALLLDFGLAAQVNKEGLTETNATLGTPAYMAPEALNAKAALGPTQDVYGVSATLYHMVTGSAPYEGTPSQIFGALATRAPVPAHVQRPNLPRDLRAILDWSLARRPEDRYSDAAALRDDLRAFLDHAPVSARPISIVRRSWRVLRRSMAFKVVAVAMLLAGLSVWGAKLRKAAVERRNAQIASAYRAIPANLTYVESLDRRVESVAARSRIEANLQELVSLVPMQVGPRLLLALFLMDQGDEAGASAQWGDLRPSLSRPMAEHFLGSPSPRDVGRLAVENAPPATTAGDAVMLGLLSVRNAREFESPKDAYVAARGHLAPFHGDLSRYGHEFLLTIRWVAREGTARDALADGLAQVRDLGNRFGEPSAQALHWEAFFLGAQERWAEAYERGQIGLEVSPDSHVLLENITHHARRLGRLDIARRMSQLTLEVAPNNLKALRHRVMVEVQAKNFDSARAMAEEVPPVRREASPELSVALHAMIDQCQAFSLLFNGDPSPVDLERARDLAGRSMTGFESLTSPSSEDQRRYEIAKAIAGEDDQMIFRTVSAMARVLRTSSAYLAAANTIPATLDSDSIEVLQSTFRSAAAALQRAGRQPLVSVSNHPPRIR